MPRSLRTATTRRVLVLFSAVLACAPVTAAEDEEALVKQGRKLYRKVCEECHGPEGHGDGEKARSLGFRPRDFGLGAFKCRCTPSGELPSDEDLLRVVTEGLDGTPMNGREKELSLDERRAVVAYVKTLTPRFADEEAPACIEIPEPQAASPSRIAEGSNIYRALSCWKCHGVTGRGDGPSADGLVDEWGAKIRVHNFVRSGKFKCGGDPRDIYRTLHTGMNGSPMASFTDAFAFAREDLGDLSQLEATFSTEEVGAIRAYLATQPDRAELRALSAEERRDLIDRRTWSLIAYLQSLLGS